MGTVTLTKDQWQELDTIIRAAKKRLKYIWHGHEYRRGIIGRGPFGSRLTALIKLAERRRKAWRLVHLLSLESVEGLSEAEKAELEELKAWHGPKLRSMNEAW